MAENIYIRPVVVSTSRRPEAQLLETIARRLAGIFNVKAMVEGRAIHLPGTVYNPRRHQYSAQMIAQLLMGENKPGKILAVADFDLYSPPLNFVFGLAAMSLGVAIISLARLRPEFYQLPADHVRLTARAVKEAVHETGHLYGLSHCPDTSCVMHFSNSLLDTDRKNENPCNRCKQMLRQREMKQYRKGKML